MLLDMVSEPNENEWMMLVVVILDLFPCVVLDELLKMLMIIVVLDDAFADKSHRKMVFVAFFPKTSNFFGSPTTKKPVSMQTRAPCGVEKYHRMGVTQHSKQRNMIWI